MSEAPTLLVADSHDLARTSLAALLESFGYRVLQASDGGGALAVVERQKIDLILFDHQMSPVDGFEFVRHLIGRNIKIPMVLLMSDRTSDLMNYASSLGIMHFLTKPVDPQRLNTMVSRLLQQMNALPSENRALASFSATPAYTPEELMTQAIELARKNAEQGNGGPFGAVVADAHGHILGEGVNLITSRCDPIAHAEVMAIRKATEKMKQTHLEGCSIFCSSEPTALAQALIVSVGIDNVYFGLSHADVDQIRTQHDDRIHEELKTTHAQRRINYIQMGNEGAFAMFTSCQDRHPDSLQD